MLTIDIAPTILDLADVEIPYYMDGESVKETLLHEKNLSFEKIILIEYWGEHDTNRVDAACPWKYDDQLTVKYFIICTSIQHVIVTNTMKP